MTLTDYIGEEIDVMFAGRRVTGVVTDVDHSYGQHDFDQQLKIRVESGSTLVVPPEAIIES